MDSKVQSILSYLGILWLVAYFVGKDYRDQFSRFHLKQGLGLIVTSIIFSIAIGIIVSIIPSLALVGNIVGLLFLVLMIIGIINAANNKMAVLPVIGNYFNSSFSFLDRD